MNARQRRGLRRLWPRGTAVKVRGVGEGVVTVHEVSRTWPSTVMVRIHRDGKQPGYTRVPLGKLRRLP